MKSVHAALEAIRNGGTIVLLDDADRENEGDFVAASQLITAEAVNLAITHGRGLVCCAVAPRIATALDLPLQVPDNTALHGTNFTVSVDAVAGVTTGISAQDRAVTLRLLAESATAPDELARPGHVFPIVAHPEGLSGRRGHTEAAVALMELAGLEPAAMICEILGNDGQAARGPELDGIARRFSLPVVHVEELIQYITREREAV